MATVVEGDPKVPFSIATTPRCREGHNSFPWTTSLYLWYVPYNPESYARRYQVPVFQSFVWLDMGLNSGVTCHCWTLYPMIQWADSISRLLSLYEIYPQVKKRKIIILILMRAYNIYRMNEGKAKWFIFKFKVYTTFIHWSSES